MLSRNVSLGNLNVRRRKLTKFHRRYKTIKEGGKQNFLYYATKQGESLSNIYENCITNDEIRIIPFITPQQFKRCKSIENNCKIARNCNNNLRNKVMSGKDDSVLRTKNRGDRYWQDGASLDMFGKIEVMVDMKKPGKSYLHQ